VSEVEEWLCASHARMMKISSHTLSADLFRSFEKDMRRLAKASRNRLLSMGILIRILLFGIYAAAQLVSSDAALSEAANQDKKHGEQAASLEEVVEDKTRLSLEGSQLFPVKPFLVQKDEMDSFTRELVSVQWRPRDPIYLYLMLPRGVKNPPIVLYLYSYPSELEVFRNDRLCRALTTGGVAAAGFCSALTGHRYKNRPMKEWFVSDLQEAVVLTVHDIDMMVDYLGWREDLDTSRIGVVGHGSGGTIAILAAALNSKIKAVEIINPWGNWPDWMRKSALIPEEERANFVEPGYLSRISYLDPLAWLPKLADKPLELQLIMSDPQNPEVCLRSIAKAAPAGARVNLFPDSRAYAESFANGHAFDWIKRTLASLELKDTKPGESR
jgi:pimeloyl-ACP methyl ester carboxylesterase